MINRDILWNAVKEPLRLLVLAVVPLAVAYLTGVGTEWALALIVVLRFVDKLMHEVGKDRATPEGDSVLLKGITRF